MSVQDFTDLSVEQFGGYSPAFPAAVLPAGASPNNQDVIFPQGAVRTRPGKGNGVIVGIAGNPTINYIKTYTDPQQNFRNLYLDSLGLMRQDFPAGIETLLNGTQGVYSSTLHAKSSTLFGREYIAGSAKGIGIEMPMQFDSTNFDRVSQVGPGNGPSSAVDANSNPAYAISFFYRVSGVSTIGIPDQPGWTAGQSIVVNGMPDPTFDGTFVIYQALGPGEFTYLQIGNGDVPYTTTGGGTAALSTGFITMGVHQVVVAFVTRQNYITRFSPPVTWTAGGSNGVTLSGIPIGPSNIIARIIAFTAAGGATWYYLTATGSNDQPGGIGTILYDNTTTTATFTFTDTTLQAGIAVNPAGSTSSRLNVQELGEVSGVIGYANRLVAWGERNRLSNAQNLTFDGGWSLGTGTGGSDVPLGWISDGTFGGGGSRDQTNILWGDAYRITGDGVNLLRGEISQGMYYDAFGVRILRDHTDYSYRVRLKAGGISQGDFLLVISAPSAGVLGTVIIPSTSINGGLKFTEFTGMLVAAQTLPADVTLTIFGGGTMTNGGFIVVENIEIFPTQTPVTNGWRVSYINDPESFDGVTGLIQVRAGDGQLPRAAWTVRNNLYLWKDHYTCYTTDDGKSEPSGWSVNEVSATIGCVGPDALDGTEEWVAFVDHSGVYIINGGDPIKISQEISDDASNTGKPTFKSINWAAASTIWLRIDDVNKRLMIGAPINGATSPNIIFVMDYKFNPTAEYITAGPGVVFSSFSGKIISHGGARKWTVWSIASNAYALTENLDGTSHLWLGGVANGKIYDLLDGNTSDDTLAINSFYDTAGIPATMEEQLLQLRSHRKLCGAVTGRVVGNGPLPAISSITSSFVPNDNVLVPGILPALTLQDANGVFWQLYIVDDGTNAYIDTFTMPTGIAFAPTLQSPSQLLWQLSVDTAGNVVASPLGGPGVGIQSLVMLGPLGIYALTVDDLGNVVTTLLGPELLTQRQVPVSTTVTVITSAPHGLVTGQWVYITAADPSYTGIWQVTVFNATTFTYSAVTLSASTTATGTYTFNISVIVAGRTKQLRGGLLQNDPVDFERYVNMQSERFYFRVGINAPGAWIQLERLCPVIKPAPIPLRGSLS